MSNSNNAWMDEWTHPDFLQTIKPKTKRLSPYSETEIWEKDEFLSIIKYEPYKRNKAALALMWDRNSRNHENPYCIRHSSITWDADYLPEYALKKKVRWSMKLKQGSRYIESRMGNELRNKIRAYNGILNSAGIKENITILNCPRCTLTNAFENKYCSKCSYPLNPEAFEEIKQTEEVRFIELEKKYNEKISNLAQDMEKKFQQLNFKNCYSKNCLFYHWLTLCILKINNQLIIFVPTS